MCSQVKTFEGSTARAADDAANKWLKESGVVLTLPVQPSTAMVNGGPSNSLKERHKVTITYTGE